jgi:hypothetical protein
MGFFNSNKVTDKQLEKHSNQLILSFTLIADLAKTIIKLETRIANMEKQLKSTNKPVEGLTRVPDPDTF